MKKFEVIVPVSYLVPVWVLAESQEDAIKTAIGIVNEAEEGNEIFDELFDFQAHEELFEHDRENIFLTIKKAECDG